MRRLLLFVVIAGSACSGGEVSGGGECSTNGDCTGSLICLDGTCIALCNSDGDCAGDGELCVRGRCSSECGDAVLNEGEECDDGATNSDTVPDACRARCTLPFCGDGVVDAGEGCDDILNDGTYGGCNPDCTPAPRCGDTVVSNGEQCDNGPANADGAGCTASCTIATCGDGHILVGVEECDDGNDATELCDYGMMSCTVCAAGCTNIPGLVSFCGDGVVQSVFGEACDSGPDNADGWGLVRHCDSTCSAEPPYCGDGMVNGGTEQCDDGQSTTCLWADLAMSRCQHVLYVDDNATGARTGLTWDDAFTEVRDALVASSPDDEIWVAAGTYLPGTDRLWSFTLRPDVALYGGFDGTETDRTLRDPVTHVTILSGDLAQDDPFGASNNVENSLHVVKSDGSPPTTILDGFTITGGNAADMGVTFGESGGGLLLVGSSLTVDNCTFINNSGRYGSAIGVQNGGTPIIRNSRFEANRRGVALWVNDTTVEVFDSEFTANESGGSFATNFNAGSMTYTRVRWEDNVTTFRGGGLTQSSGVMRCEDCTFINNQGFEGGAYYHSGPDATFVRADFRGNIATQDGGGIYTLNGGTMTLLDVTFNSNDAARHAGAMRIAGGTDTDIVNATFDTNTAANRAGALYVSGAAAPTTLTNARFNGNTSAFGGALWVLNAPVTISQSTFNNNAAVTEGDDIRNDGGTLVITNSVSWNNGDFYVEISGTASVDNSCVQGGWTGPGLNNLDQDPLFTDPAGPDMTPGTADDDLTLGMASMCRDAGSNTLIPADILDTDGDLDTAEPLPQDLSGAPRIHNTTVDPGAYEWRP